LRAGVGALRTTPSPRACSRLWPWYLSDCGSDEGVGHGGEVRRFVEELEAMKSNAILGEQQVNRALRALAPIGEQQGETK
jgi:hypothetical protein